MRKSEKQNFHAKCNNLKLEDLKGSPKDHWLFGSREEHFIGFLPYMVVAVILVKWP